MPKGKPYPYGFVCDGCGHPGSEHLLAVAGDLRAGPYRCGRCDCAIAQDAPMTGVDRRTFYELFPEREADDA